MNANELADKLDLINERQNIQIQAAAMLRQQQAREDSLCSMVKEYQDKVDELRAEIEALKLHNKKLQWALAQQTNLLGVEK